jgi:hypothetical protein
MMGRANVYLPDDLERRVKAAQIPVSEVCQRALLAAVEAAENGAGQLPEPLREQYRSGWAAGGQWAEAADAVALLTLIREQRLDDIPVDALPPSMYALNDEQTLAWETGFVDGARAGARAALPVVTEPDSVKSEPDPVAEDSTAAPTVAPGGPDDGAEADPPPLNLSKTDDDAGLGDSARSYIGVTIDGKRVSFDPHAAVRASKSPLYAILGDADVRSRLTLGIAQDAAARGSAVVLVDVSGHLTARATGLGKNVRVLNSSLPAIPAFDDLLKGTAGLGGLHGLGGLFSTFTGMSGMAAGGPPLTQLLTGGKTENLIKPGYVTILRLSVDNGLESMLSIAQAIQALSQLATPVEFPRLVQVDLPDGLAVPAGLSSQLGRVVRSAREHDAAIGLSAGSAEFVSQIAGNGAMLSTVVAFATSSPAEADRLRGLIGGDAPVLLNPPGTTTAAGDQVWAVMRDLDGRVGQLRITDS